MMAYTENETYTNKFAHTSYLLFGSKTCPKQVSKGLKYIKWTTNWAQKSGLT